MKKKIKQEQLQNLQTYAGKSVDGENLLGWFEFIILLFSMELSFYETMLIFLAFHGGTECFFFAYMSVSIFGGIPLVFVQVFLGYFSRKGYFALGNMMPFAKGLCWILVLKDLISRMFDLTYASTSLLYIPELFKSTLPWTNCDFYQGNITCFAMNHKGYPGKCCPYFDFTNGECNGSNINMYFHYAPELYHGYLINYSKASFSWVISLTLTYALVLIITMFNICKIQRFLCVMFFILMFLLVVPAFVEKGSLAVKSEVYPSGIGECLNIDFAVQIVRFALLRYIRGSFFAFGALAPSSFIPERDVILVFVITTTVIYGNIKELMTGLNSLKANYEIEDLNCLSFQADFTPQTVILDLITRWNGNRVALFLWLTSTALLPTFLTSIIIGLIARSISETFKFFKKRYRLCAFMTNIICFGPNIMLILFCENPFKVSILWDKTGNQLIGTYVLFLFCCILMGYSLSRLQKDIKFLFKENASVYWEIGLKFTFILAALVLLYTCVRKKPKSLVGVELFYYYLVAGIILSLIFIVAILHVLFVEKNKHIFNIFKRSKLWGPPTKALKIRRNRFNSTNDTFIKFRGECEHNCLLHSVQLRKLVNAQDRLKKEFITANHLEYLNLESDLMFV